MIKPENIVSQDSRRIYYVVDRGIFWDACFQPINARTGKPWQASRRVGMQNHDVYHVSKWDVVGEVLGEPVKSFVCEVRRGPVPEWGVLKAEGWLGRTSGFSSRELAMAACRAHNPNPDPMRYQNRTPRSSRASAQDDEDTREIDRQVRLQILSDLHDR